MGLKKLNRLTTELADATMRVSELRAQLASSLGSAYEDLPKAGTPLHGSTAIIEIRALAGRTIVGPVAIRDGLSKATIEALQNDLRRSFYLATLVSAGMAIDYREKV